MGYQSVYDIHREISNVVYDQVGKDFTDEEVRAATIEITEQLTAEYPLLDYYGDTAITIDDIDHDDFWTIVGDTITAIETKRPQQ
jgi:hypothetical protein